MAGAQRDGKPIGMQKGTDGGRPVGAVTVEMSPGTSTELVFTVLRRRAGRRRAGARAGADSGGVPVADVGGPLPGVHAGAS